MRISLLYVMITFLLKNALLTLSLFQAFTVAVFSEPIIYHRWIIADVSVGSTQLFCSIGSQLDWTALIFYTYRV